MENFIKTFQILITLKKCNYIFIILFINLYIYVSMSSSTFVPSQASIISQTGTGIATANWPTNVYFKKKRPSIETIDRRARQLSSLSTTNLQAAGSTDYGYGVSAGSEYGGYAAAGTHGGGYGHGGGGGGGGHGHGKKDCNAALGLLGVLGLVSFLQNVLRQMTTTAAPMGRKKRETELNNSNGIDVDQITGLMMPLLMRVAQVKDGIILPKCVLPETCRANGILVKRLGSEGRSLGSMLSESIVKMIKDIDGTEITSKQIDTAARTGRSGLDCEKLYKECPNIPPTDSSLYSYLLQGKRV